MGHGARPVNLSDQKTLHTVFFDLAQPCRREIIPECWTYMNSPLILQIGCVYNDLLYLLFIYLGMCQMLYLKKIKNKMLCLAHPNASETDINYISMLFFH